MSPPNAADPSTAADDALVAVKRPANTPQETIRQTVARISASLHEQFRDGADIRWLIRERAKRIDTVMSALWSQAGLHLIDGIALAAVGGYGRGELHPHSDIDLLLILADDGIASEHRDALESFIASLWDTGLTIGHSVRTPEDCRQAAIDDITIATNLMESRWLAGAPSLLDQVQRITGPDQIWPSAEFFRAKWDEQIARHRKFNNTEYNLEPNVKGCPGGLRDVQTIGWIAKRHFGDTSTRDLLVRGFLTEREYDALMAGQDFLWRIRYGLHMLTDRAEDRLLFDHQLQLSRLFGYQDDENGLGVEHFMKDYFRWVLRLGVLNESLTQLFDEAILRACEPIHYFDLNLRFRVRNGYIEATHDNVFKMQPSALIEIFVLMAEHDFIVGVRAETTRLIHQNRWLINDSVREDPESNRLFMRLLGAPFKVTSTLDRMKRYGVLGRFIPEFGRIIGQTQHDMFHVYSVDSHTLRVIANMRRLRLPEHADAFPAASHAVKRLPSFELLLIAGLFHDIAKGRGGDHSNLGADDAYRFCARMGLRESRARLCAWLVRQHLMMSTTAQRKDISDPAVINDFTQLVGDQVHLDYLYALTVADINATNPTLWNSWKASLLQSLYIETKRALRRGLENPVDVNERIEETRQLALALLESRGYSDEEIATLWSHMGDDYFLRESPIDVVWHTESILEHATPERPLVLFKRVGTDQAPMTQIFIYAPPRDFLFAIITSALDQLALDIHGARIYSSTDQKTLDSFFVLERDGSPVAVGGPREREIHAVLLEHLSAEQHTLEAAQRHTSRALKYFKAPTRTRMTTDPNKGYSVLEVMTPDRAGLLARIGKVFYDFSIQVHTARITTLGESVEDVFYITDSRGQPLDDDNVAEQLQTAIRAALDTAQPERTIIF